MENNEEVENTEEQHAEEDGEFEPERFNDDDSEVHRVLDSSMYSSNTEM